MVSLSIFLYSSDKSCRIDRQILLTYRTIAKPRHWHWCNLRSVLLFHWFYLHSFVCVALCNFTTRVALWDLHGNQEIQLTHPHETPHTALQPTHTLHLHNHVISRLVHAWVTHNVPFWDWLSPPIIISLRCIHVAVLSIVPSFSLLICIPWMDHSFFKQSPIEGRTFEQCLVGSYYQWSCYEQSCTCSCVKISLRFSGMNAQECNRCVYDALGRSRERKENRQEYTYGGGREERGRETDLC